MKKRTGGALGLVISPEGISFVSGFILVENEANRRSCLYCRPVAGPSFHHDSWIGGIYRCVCPCQSLSSCLVETYGIGYEEASAAIREFVRETKSALQQKNLVSFPKVGRLRLDFEGNIQFLPDAENLNPDSFGLPEIRFRPLKRSEPEPPTPTPASVAPARLRAPVSSGLVLGLAILAVTVTAYFLFRPQINALFSFRAEEEAPMERVNVAPPEPLREPSAETPDEEGAADTLEAPTLAPQQKQCIVVIGLFREKSNIDRLVQRIYAEGFEPYLEKNGAITRVGVQFPYTTEEDIAGPLRKVQSNLEPKAFVWKK